MPITPTDDSITPESSGLYLIEVRDGDRVVGYALAERTLFVPFETVKEVPELNALTEALFTRYNKGRDMRCVLLPSGPDSSSRGYVAFGTGHFRSGGDKPLK